MVCYAFGGGGVGNNNRTKLIGSIGQVDGSKVGQKVANLFLCKKQICGYVSSNQELCKCCGNIQMLNKIGNGNFMGRF